MVILAKRHGLGRGVICAFLGIDAKTYLKYLRIFKRGGTTELFARQTKSSRKFDDETLKEAVFSLLHEPPSNYGINRTSWKMPDFARVLREKGQPACPEVIRRITKVAGYRWRKARVVLTSHDPAYSEKLDRIRTILSSLRPDDAFFSIDEYGPFAVKMKPGLTLTAPGEQRIVPQWQKSRGCLLMTAALELSGNQVTHFYSAKKNTEEMIRMMEIVIDQYRDRRRLYLSWDGASWHISKRLFKRIEEHNAAVLDGGGPLVETAPLPTGAQFLNVIEFVFSGMARSIVHNSDYKTVFKTIFGAVGAVGVLAFIAAAMGGEPEGSPPPRRCAHPGRRPQAAGLDRDYGQPSVLAYKVLQAIFLKLTEDGCELTGDGRCIYNDTVTFNTRA